MAAPKQPSMGELADRIYAMGDDVAKAEAAAEAVKNERKALESSLMNLMAEQQIDSVRGEFATCSISDTTRASIVDFAAFEKFCLRKKSLHLFEKRVAQKALQEMEETMGKEVPGLQRFTTQRLNVRKR